MAEIIFEKKGIAAKPRKTGRNTYILQYSCKRGLDLAKWIYADGELCLKRKYHQYKIALNGGKTT